MVNNKSKFKTVSKFKLPKGKNAAQSITDFFDDIGDWDAEAETLILKYYDWKKNQNKQGE